MNHPYADRPVPIIKPGLLPTLARAAVPIDFRDSRANEKLVDVRKLGVRGDNFYARRDGSNPPYRRRIDGAFEELLLRESVAARLADVDCSLRRYDLRLYVLDGYRPIATQYGLWRFFWDHFARSGQGLTEAEIEAKTLTFVSDPRSFDRNDPRTWPLHSTGGAVDLTLCGEAGEFLDLGTAFDDATAAAATAFFEQALDKEEISPDDPRLLSRRILYWSMRDGGFTNYVNEWWHFDLGDQLHVLTRQLLGEPVSSGAAWYGYTEPDSQ